MASNSMWKTRSGENGTFSCLPPTWNEPKIPALHDFQQNMYRPSEKMLNDESMGPAPQKDNVAQGTATDPVRVKFPNQVADMWVYVEADDHVLVETPFMISHVEDTPFCEVKHQSDRQALLRLPKSTPTWAGVKLSGFRDSVTLHLRSPFEQALPDPAPPIHAFVGTWVAVRGAHTGQSMEGRINPVVDDDGAVTIWLTLPDGRSGMVLPARAQRPNGPPVLVLRAPTLDAEVAFPLAGLVAVGIVQGEPFAAVRTPDDAEHPLHLVAEGLMRGLALPTLDENDGASALVDYVLTLAADDDAVRFLRTVALQSSTSPVARDRIQGSARKPDPAEGLADAIHQASMADAQFGVTLDDNLDVANRERAQRMWLELCGRLGNAATVCAAAATSTSANSQQQPSRQDYLEDADCADGMCKPPSNFQQSEIPPLTVRSRASVLSQHVPTFNQDDIDYVQSVVHSVTRAARDDRDAADDLPSSPSSSSSSDNDGMGEYDVDSNSSSDGEDSDD